MSLAEHSHLTGIAPDTVDAKFFSEHRSAYTFTKRFAAGKRVLEIGFGDGYGAAELAEVAVEVFGIDTTAPNIPRAQQKYGRPNLRFERMDGTTLDFPDRSFDLVCSFQVIEHIPEPLLPIYVGEIYRVLRIGGAACLSTLNLAHNMKPGQPYEKLHCHEKEFTAPELRAVLSTTFSNIELLGLHLTMRHRAFQRLKRWGIDRLGPAEMNPVRDFYRRVSVDDFVVTRDISVRAIDLYAVCRKTTA